MSQFKILKEYEENLMFIYDYLNKSGVTNNIELTKLGNILFGDLFIGVFSADKFPKYIKNGQMFIINNKSSKQEGEHWLAFIKSDKNKDHKQLLYGYDSYNRDIRKLNHHFKKKRFINANSNRDESYAEKDCGQRSLCWLISFHKWGDKIIKII